MTDTELATRASQLHQRAIIIDALGWAFVERPTAIIDGKDQVDKTVEAGITASSQYLASHWLDDLDEVLHKFWRYYGLLEVKADKTLLVQSVDDILQAKEQKKLGLIMAFQGASPIGNDLAYMTIFHRLGLRIMGIAYDRQNLLGYGCREPEDRGLSAFGLTAVKEANRLGILLDCSHTGIKTSLDVIRASTKPVVFTHSNVRADRCHWRMQRCHRHFNTHLLCA
jgi:membrane dipeptidase